MKPIKIVERYPDGTIKYEIWIKRGCLHHSTEPAYKSYYSSGDLFEEIYYLNGKIGRRVEMEETSKVAYRKWNIKKVLVAENKYYNNDLHFKHLRWDDDKDKFIGSHYDGETHVPERSWYSDGSLKHVWHSRKTPDGTPGHIAWDDKGNVIYEAWGYNDNWYRNDGNPAIIEYYSSGQRKKEVWHEKVNSMKRPKLHRTNGPAISSWYEDGTPKTCKYYINSLKWNDVSQLHRTDGPAVQKWNKKGEIIVEEYHNILEKPTLTKNAK